MALPSDNQHVTYQLQHRKCGKASCSTCRDGQGHGPYWYAYWREGTRLRSGYVGKVNPYLSVESDQENMGTTSDAVAMRSSSSEQRHTSEKAHSVEPYVITSVSA